MSIGQNDNLPIRYTIPDIQAIAQEVAKSGLFGMTQAQAFTMMLLAQAKGIHPISAVERYHIIKSRPAMKADTMLGDFQDRRGTVEWHRHDEQECSATFDSPGLKEPVTVTWTIADAKRAELLANNMWQKYPRQMLRARVISEGIRLAMPSIITGIVTPEEANDPDPDIEASYRVVDGPAASRTESLARKLGGGGETETAPAPAQPAVEKSPDAPRRTNGHGADARPDTWAGWVARCVRKVSDSWDAEAKMELGADIKAEPLANQHQLMNHVATGMIEGGIIEESAIADTRTGKRDRGRTLAAVNDHFRADPEWVKSAVISHIRELRSRERARLGMPDLDSDGGEVPNEELAAGPNPEALSNATADGATSAREPGED